jgi:hypothetical protein
MHANTHLDIDACKYSTHLDIDACKYSTHLYRPIHSFVIRVLTDEPIAAASVHTCAPGLCPAAEAEPRLDRPDPGVS